MLARTNRLSPAMLTTTSVITGRIRCRPMSPIAASGLLAEVRPSTRRCRTAATARVSVMPLAGRMFRPGPLKMKISMMPSQNVGMAKPT